MNNDMTKIEVEEPCQNPKPTEKKISDNNIVDIIFAIQNKGGVGKSVLTFKLIEKYLHHQKGLFVFDTDIKNKTTIRNFKNVQNLNIIPYSFYTEENTKREQLDKQSFTDLLMKIKDISEEQDKNLFLVDCSATVSETIPSLLNSFDSMAEFDSVLKEMNIRISFFGVVIGGDGFEATFGTFQSLVESLDNDYYANNLKVYLFANKYNKYSYEQNNSLKKLEGELNKKNQNKKSLFFYDVTDVRGGTTDQIIKKMFEDGKGYAGVNPLRRLQFNNCQKTFTPLEEIGII